MAKLILPFKCKAKITQVFGNKLILNGVDVYGQWGLQGHNGIDYGLENDTELFAPHSGKILEATYDKEGYGWYLKIESDKEGSILAHMRKFTVNLGDWVEQGQSIGFSNNSGYSTGPHLHWGYYQIPRDKNNGFNGYIDQTPYLTESPTLPTSQPSGDYAKDIRDFLVSVGYTYPEAHLEVIKVMYQSDLNLKSGKYITKENCNKEKDNLKQEHEDKLTSLRDEQKEAIENALKKAKKDWKVEELQGQVAECEKLRQTTAYKIASNVGKILEVLKIIKKSGGDKNGSTGIFGDSKGSSQ